VSQPSASGRRWGVIANAAPRVGRTFIG
jgi:hypothetical protein